MWILTTTSSRYDRGILFRKHGPWPMPCPFLELRLRDPFGRALSHAQNTLRSHTTSIMGFSWPASRTTPPPSVSHAPRRLAVPELHHKQSELTSGHGQAPKALRKNTSLYIKYRVLVVIVIEFSTRHRWDLRHRSQPVTSLSVSVELSIVASGDWWSTFLEEHFWSNCHSSLNGRILEWHNGDQCPLVSWLEIIKKN